MRSGTATCVLVNFALRGCTHGRGGSSSRGRGAGGSGGGGGGGPVVAEIAEEMGAGMRF